MHAPLAIWMRTIAVIAAALLGLLAEVASAQVWSPDGKRLAWPDPAGVAVLDVATGATRCIVDRIEYADASRTHGTTRYRAAGCAWTADGAGLVVAMVSSGNLRVEVLAGDTRRSFQCGAVGEYGDDVEIVVLGNRVLAVANGQLMRVDLDSGNVVLAPGQDNWLQLQRRGAHLWCARLLPGRARWWPDLGPNWQLALVDSDTLTPLPFRALAQTHPEWALVPQPVLAPAGDRCAVPAYQFEGDAGAIAVLRGDDTEDLVRVTTGEDAGIGGVAWRHDGRALYVGIERNPESELGWYLREVPLDGGAQRETCLRAGVRCRCLGASWGRHPTVVLSPDGRLVAMQCWVGLFLVDVKDPARRVTKVPFPTRP